FSLSWKRPSGHENRSSLRFTVGLRCLTARKCRSAISVNRVTNPSTNIEASSTSRPVSASRFRNDLSEFGCAPPSYTSERYSKLKTGGLSRTTVTPLPRDQFGLRLSFPSLRHWEMKSSALVL